GTNANVVQPQERQARGQSDALVAVDERMVLHEVEKIRRGLLMKRWVEELVAEGCLRHRQCGLEEATITDTERPAVASHLVGMDGQHLVEGEEGGGHGGEARQLLGQTAKSPCMLPIEVVQNLLEPGRALRRADWRDDDHIAVGRDLELRIRV